MQQPLTSIVVHSTELCASPSFYSTTASSARPIVTSTHIFSPISSYYTNMHVHPTFASNILETPLIPSYTSSPIAFTPSISNAFNPFTTSAMANSTLPNPFLEPASAPIELPSHSQIIVHQLPPLKFASNDVSLWFQRFHARFHKLQLNDEQLYYELLNCLDEHHIQRVAHVIRYQPPFYHILKNALITAYAVPYTKRHSNLKQVPPLGNRAPTELLMQLRATLGKNDFIDNTARLLILDEFLDRMPPDVKKILRLFQHESLDFIAEKSDALMQNDEYHWHDGCNFHTMHNDTNLLQHAGYERSLHRPSVYRNSFSHKNMVDEPARIKLDARRIFPSLPKSSSQPVDSRSAITNGLCYYHLNFLDSPNYCVQGCKHYNPLNSNGGASLRQPLRSPSTQ